MKILLVYPPTPTTFWSFAHVMPFISRKSAFPPLGLLTVAAMLPREWNLKLVDVNVTNLTDAHIDWADYVLISGMIVHADSARAIILRCNARSKRVIAGGPLFTTGHERFPEVRHFVLAESEGRAPVPLAALIAAADRLKQFVPTDTQSGVRGAR